jgi:hypothetical protein
LLSLAVVLAAFGLPSAADYPTCTPLQSLTPDQAIVGRAYDAKNAWTRRPVTPESLLVGGSLCRWERSDESPAKRVRRALAYGCENTTAVIGVVTARRFLVSPERYYVFGEYDVTVEQRVSPVGRGAELTGGATIKVYRDGGVVCAPEGELRALNRDQKPFDVGGRYLLFLKPTTPQGNGFASSEFDWSLDDGAKRAQLTHVDHVEESVDVTAAELVAHMETIPQCQ